MIYEPETPIPSRMLSIGPPKQAEKPMTGANAATEMFAMRSARELPTAKMVRPMIASERPKMKPNVYGRLILAKMHTKVSKILVPVGH